MGFKSTTIKIAKNLYFYRLLYSVSILLVLVVALSRYDVIASDFSTFNWTDLAVLIYTLYSLPILLLHLASKLSTKLSIVLAALSALVILLLFIFSTNSATTFVSSVKRALEPCLVFLFIFSALMSVITIWRTKR